MLVVDDSRAIRDRLVQILREACGPDALLEASSADEALETLGSHAVDVVVLDLHMPGKSGLEIIARIKLAELAPVVVVLTNHPNEPLRRECLAQGADFFFDKSKDFDQLIGIVNDPQSERTSTEEKRRARTR